MFNRIDHVEIVTDQLDRTVQFYTEVLGFTVKVRDRIERSGLGVPIDLVYLDLGGTVVELISYGRRHGRPGSTNRASGISHDGAGSRRYAEDGRLSKDQGCRHRLGSKGPGDLFKG
jgi:catechol 2,3-dioxygenase-like lactoylglutathione lyase family enzyme